MESDTFKSEDFKIFAKFNFQEKSKLLTFLKLLKRLMNTFQLTKFIISFPTIKSDAVSVVGFFLAISFCTHQIETNNLT